MQPSPYTPGSVSTSVPGRRKNIEDFRQQLAYTSQFHRLSGQISVTVGPRGIGKTSLLRYLQAEALELGFQTVWVTAGDGAFLPSLIESFNRLSAGWKETSRRRLAELLHNLTVTVGGISLSTSPGREPSGVPASAGRALQDVISGAAQSAVDDGALGLVLFVDEIQSADVEGLRALAYAWQHMQSENPDLPAIAAAAGLSHSQDVITDAVSFAERFRYPRLKDLDDVAARSALIAPAADGGVEWDEGALTTALHEARGYPYFIQLLGDESWKAAHYPDPDSRISAEDVHTAMDEYRTAQADFFRARWMKATDAEAQMLLAMASLGDTGMRRRDIADRMGRTTNDISMVRRSLMDKGIIQSSGFGELSFTAPGFADFVREELDSREL
ncbi:ATP-binding protein [Corynebacterium sp. AOP40-9SA-29]|uniref:ATP-binding protein n=1 Tax=Corynebacterium sp. AOP40-9SA-29 TaxID=3457677 RepID=UPI004034E22A